MDRKEDSFHLGVKALIFNEKKQDAFTRKDTIRLKKCTGYSRRACSKRGIPYGNVYA